VALQGPPFSVDRNSLFVAYYASAELGCLLKLGWKLPERILDLYVEFQRLTCDLNLPFGKGLVGALRYFGLDTIEAEEKTSMRDLAMRGGSYTPEERSELLDYCQSDVDALARLLPRMAPSLDLPRAVLPPFSVMNSTATRRPDRL